MGRFSVSIVILVWLSVFSFIAFEASGEIVLTVDGPGDADPIKYTDLRIRALPQSSFSTFDPWDRRRRLYTGVNLLTLLEDIGRLKNIGMVEVISRNNYRAYVDPADLQNYGHMLSYAMDGSPYSNLGKSDKGPLAVAVKMDYVREEDKSRITEQFVWWIERIVLK